jgi:hypothetical protein
MKTGIFELSDSDGIEFFIGNAPLCVIHGTYWPSKVLFSKDLLDLLDRKKVTGFRFASAAYAKLGELFKSLKPQYNEYFVFAHGTCVGRFQEYETGQDPMVDLIRMAMNFESYSKDRRQRFHDKAMAAIRAAQARAASKSTPPPPPPPTPPPVNSPFGDLEIAETATFEQARAAYLQIIKEYHPDKVDAAGKKLKALALEETTKANKAFEKIKLKFGKA